jgi:hypothetical protein
MRSWVFGIVGVVLVLVGLLWVLQGLGAMGNGGFMDGSKTWFAIGLLVGLVGLASVYSGVRRRSTAKR